MLLFRSEDEIEAWCRARRVPRGGTMSLPRLQELARAWYGDRLAADWQPRGRREAQQLLGDVGLHGDFWRL